MLVMYEHSEKRLTNVLKFQAAIHGVKISDEDGSGSGEGTTPDRGKPKEARLFQFGDPDEYKKMDPDEAEKLTQRMMSMHKEWAIKEKPLGGKQARVG
jgi:hypothetical protein